MVLLLQRRRLNFLCVPVWVTLFGDCCCCCCHFLVGSSFRNSRRPSQCECILITTSNSQLSSSNVSQLVWAMRHYFHFHLCRRTKGELPSFWATSIMSTTTKLSTILLAKKRKRKMSISSCKKRHIARILSTRRDNQVYFYVCPLRKKYLLKFSVYLLDWDLQYHP